jgi:hypothetical protein
MATKKQVREAAAAGQITKNEANLLSAAIDRAAKTGGGISASETARLNQALEQAKTSAIAKGGVTAQQLLGTAAERQQAFGITPGAAVTQPAPTVPATPLPDPFAAAREADTRSAYAIVEDAFSKYGLGSLVPLIRQFRIKGLSPEEAQLELEKAPEFRTRFVGNEGRIAKGLQAYKPGEYLQAEEAYANLLRSNNLTALANKTTFDKLIGGAVSPTEAQDRINLVFNKIDTAPQDVKNELGRYFSSFGVGDSNVQRTQIAEAILSGEDPAMKLEMNVRKAQLRAGATAAGLAPTEERLAAIERLTAEAGISNAYVAGQQGFQTLSRIEPFTQTLAQRFGEASVAEEELTKESFLGLESQRRKRLKEQEQALFGGSAGITQASLATSPAGQI